MTTTKTMTSGHPIWPSRFSAALSLKTTLFFEQKDTSQTVVDEPLGQVLALALLEAELFLQLFDHLILLSVGGLHVRSFLLLFLQMKWMDLS